MIKPQVQKRSLGVIEPKKDRLCSPNTCICSFVIDVFRMTSIKVLLERNKSNNEGSNEMRRKTDNIAKTMGLMVSMGF